MSKSTKIGPRRNGTQRNREFRYQLHFCFVELAHSGAICLLIGASVAAFGWLLTAFGIEMEREMERGRDYSYYAAHYAKELTPRGAFYLSLICAGVAVLSLLFLWAKRKASKGTPLNPLPPQLRPVLPDQEMLVRASSPSAAQPAELLRAAQETKEQRPEELLRVISE